MPFVPQSLLGGTWYSGMQVSTMVRNTPLFLHSELRPCLPSRSQTQQRGAIFSASTPSHVQNHEKAQSFFTMPNCPSCGHYFDDYQWMLQQRGVQPYYKSSAGERCRECGCLKSNAPTQKQREQGVKINPWGQIVGFDGTPIRLQDDRIQRHNHNILSSDAVVAFHQTSFGAAASIMSSQKFRPGSDGCVGQGMYFAQSPGDTHAKTRQRGVILAAEVRLGARYSVSLAESHTWNRTQSCETTLEFLTSNGCE